MCGIVGYIGKKEAFPILINGLKRLEYRGYDSAGIALLNGDMTVFKKAGKVSELEKIVDYSHTNPRVLSSFPTTNIKGGIQLKMSLTQ